MHLLVHMFCSRKFLGPGKNNPSMELVARILAIAYSGILILLVPFDIYFLIVVTYARQVRPKMSYQCRW